VASQVRRVQIENKVIHVTQITENYKKRKGISREISLVRRKSDNSTFLMATFCQPLQMLAKVFR